jgi:Short C-terminal domain
VATGEYAAAVESIVTIFVVLLVSGVVAGLFGRARDRAMARRIGDEVAARTATDPILLLAELERLRQAGVVSDEEFEQQKARILGSPGPEPV